MVDAIKESEAWRALKRYLMVKAVLIQPLRGGGGRHNRNINLTQKLMTAFYRGNEDEVWRTSTEIEIKRGKNRAAQIKKRSRKRTIQGEWVRGKRPRDEIKRRSDRAKVLTNDGELSKAFATMVQRGVAPSTEDIIAQLGTKFPKRMRKLYGRGRIESMS